MNSISHEHLNNSDSGIFRISVGGREGKALMGMGCGGGGWAPTQMEIIFVPKMVTLDSF